MQVVIRREVYPQSESVAFRHSEETGFLNCAQSFAKDKSRDATRHSPIANTFP